MPVSNVKDTVTHPAHGAGTVQHRPSAQRQRDSVRPADVCGIVLAGSLSWGEGAFEQMIRGPLLPLAQTPLIQYALDWLRVGGVPSAVVCARASTGAVRARLGSGAALGIHLDYFEDREPRGPAGCAHDAARMSSAKVFVVVEGSMIPSLDLAALLAQHRATGASATVVVEVERRTRGGAMTDPRQPGGIYVFDRRVLENVPARGYQDIKQGLLERLHAADELVSIHEIHGIAPRVLDSATYLNANRWLITEEIRKPRFLADHVHVGEGLRHPTARVDPSAIIIGPVLLGPDVVVESKAVIVGPTSLGRASRVASGAVVARSCLWEQCVVGEGANVDSSLLADHAQVMRGETLFAAAHLQAPPVRPPSPVRAPFASRRLLGERRLIVRDGGRHSRSTRREISEP